VPLSSRTPLKAERFERDDAFFASFFSKKNDEKNNASSQIQGNTKQTPQKLDVIP